MLRIVQYKHLLLVLLLQLIVVLLAVHGYLVSNHRADQTRTTLTTVKLVVELRLQEGLLVLVAEVRIRHVKGRGLRGVVTSCVHLPRYLSTLEVYQSLLEWCQDVLAAHVLLKFLPILLNN